MKHNYGFSFNFILHYGKYLKEELIYSPQFCLLVELEIKNRLFARNTVGSANSVFKEIFPSEWCSNQFLCT